MAYQGEDAAKKAAQDPAVQQAVVGAAAGIAQDAAQKEMDAAKKSCSEMPKPWFIMRCLNIGILVSKVIHVPSVRSGSCACARRGEPCDLGLSLPLSPFRSLNPLDCGRH